jgi:tetratricopeptide (TPR) repeat protein
MVGRPQILFPFILAVFFLSACSGAKDPGFDLEKTATARPSHELFLFDYAGILKDVEGYTNRYLETLRDRYHIEGIIVTLPALGERHAIEDLAADMLSNWAIGRESGGRGLLLLMADHEKAVKLEVSYELEDVFTDAFCGYVADLQLKPYFLSSQPGTGLLAVMEEIEKRASIKHQASYSAGHIESLDQKLLSGGAGARRDLSMAQQEKVKDVGWKYPPGKTPSRAWQTLIRSWRDKVRDPKLGVYTQVGQLISRNYQNLPDSRYDRNYRTYGNKPFEVIQNDHHAVIFFGTKEGWDNSPFLFCRTPEGWRFDLVNQRRYIRMGPSPHWGVERANHPYVDLLSHCPYYQGQDIPLMEADRYQTDKDRETADRIKALEEALEHKPDDFDTVMSLGRLYTIVSMGPRQISLLKKARQIKPNHPDPHKYLAIAHVDTTYQYESALQEIKKYIKKTPTDVFAHNYLGYILFCLGDYPGSIKAFEWVLERCPENCYACCKLSRCYGQLFLKASQTDSKKDRYKNLAIRMLHRAEGLPCPDTERIGWLKDWLRHRKIHCPPS